MINCFFLVELIVFFSVFGKEGFKMNKGHTTEIVVQVLAIAAYVNYNKLNKSNALSLNLMNVIILFRLSRFVSILTEVYTYKIILETMNRFALPFWTLNLSLYMIFYIFAYIGMIIFGGMLT